MKKYLITNKLTIIGFIGYFLFLSVERILALVFSINQGDNYALSSNWFFPYVAYICSAISLIGLLIFLFLAKDMIKPLFSKTEKYDFNANYKWLIIAATISLLGGMMHTGFTQSALQFTAYGFLILAMLMHTIDICFDGHDKFDAIISLIYLVTFSMCIPVCYTTKIEGALGTAFYVSEFVGVAVILPIFGILLYQFFINEKANFSPIYFLIMLILAGLMVGLKWTDPDGTNMFVFIFLIVTAVIYLIYWIKKCCFKKQTNN